MNQLAGRPEAESEQVMIDRLVDGELSDDERRRYLESLDQDPARWRRVALGFIESQCCAQALGELTSMLSSPEPQRASASVHRETVMQPQAVASPNTATDEQEQAQVQSENGRMPQGEAGLSQAAGAHRRRQRLLRWAPVIASVAVAFSLGFVAQSRWSDWAERSSRRLPSPRMVGGFPVEPVANHMSAFEARGNGPSRTIKLPLVPGSPTANHWLRESDKVVSPELEQSLFRYGHRVSEQRRVYPVQLKDGRRILVPVKDIKLKYVGNYGYQ